VPEQFVFPFDAANPGLESFRTPLPSGACIKFYESPLSDEPPSPKTPTAAETSREARRAKKQLDRAAAQALVNAPEVPRECSCVDSL
jgi:hypothetical protein